ncbi:MAG: aminodeoxychorismate lyase [Ostreibacterium sp.]
MSHELVSDYQPSDSLSQYGDGVFETMLAVGSDIHHWAYHWDRLKSSCQRLQIAVPNHELLSKQLGSALVAYNYPFSVVKMLVSRGEGLRGYRTKAKQPCFVQFSFFPYQVNPGFYQGLSIRVCQTRLSSQPLLAGIKHVNRLEYVMARREPEESKFDEGLLLDYDNHLIEGLMSNVFIIKGSNVLTPSLKGSGVAGTMRAYLVDKLPQLGYPVKIQQVKLSELADATSVFLTNAINGLMPIAHIQGISSVFDITVVNSIRQQVEHPCSEQ